MEHQQRQGVVSEYKKGEGGMAVISTVYVKRHGAPIKEEDAPVIAERLIHIETKKKQDVTKETVLEDANSKSSPLHRFFDWDDSTAAHKHRLSTAARLIRSFERVEVGRYKKGDKIVIQRDRRQVGVIPITSVVREKGIIKIIPTNVNDRIMVNIGTKDEPNRVYKTTEEVKQNPDWTRQAMERSHKELLSWLDRYQGYGFVLDTGVKSGMEALIRRIEIMIGEEDKIVV